MPEDLVKAIKNIKGDIVLAEVKRRIEAGENPLNILDECRKGMITVGEEYKKAQQPLAGLILSGEIFKKVFQFLEPHLPEVSFWQSLGKVVIATLQGDIHDLGKDIVVTLLKARGFEVHNLGVDVPVEVFVQKVKEVKPDFVGFSSLLTPNIKVIKDAVDMLGAEGLRDNLKVMIGGGITTPFIKDYVGADFQTLDANDGVNYCVRIMGGE